MKSLMEAGFFELFELGLRISFVAWVVISILAIYTKFSSWLETFI